MLQLLQNTDCIVISSPSRVGSTLLQQIIASAGFTPPRASLISTHNPFYLPTGSCSALILVSRKNLFNAVMSTIVAQRTKEFTYYTNKSTVPFEVDCSPAKEFSNQWNWHKYYWKCCTNLDHYRLVEKFYFEDFVDNFDHVYSRLGIQPVIKNPSVTAKSPYKYQDWILNYDECFEKFQWLETNSKSVLINKSNINN